MKPLWPMHAGGIITLLLLLAVAWGVGAGPRLNAQAEYWQLLAQLQDCREALQLAQNSEQAARARAVFLRESITQHPLVLHAPGELNERLQQITDLAVRIGLQVNGIEAGDTTRFTRCNARTILFTGRGRYHEVLDFLRQLHQNMPDTDVVAATLSGRNGDASAQASVTMKLRWYTTPTAVVARR